MKILLYGLIGFVLGLIVNMILSNAVHADPPAVKYCTNDGGNTIITVGAGYPCPFGWYEL